MVPIHQKADWNAFVLRHAPVNGAFLQSWEWGMVQEAGGKTVVRYRGNEAVAQVIEMSLPMGLHYGYIPRGPIGISSTAEADAIKILCDQLRGDLFLRVDLARAAVLSQIREYANTSHTRIHPTPDVQPSTTLVTHLMAPTDDLLAAMHQKTRYNIRLAEKKGVEVTVDGADLNTFTRLTEATARRHKVAFHGRKHFEAILACMNGEGGAPRVFLASAVHEGDVLAVALCIDWNGVRTYLHGASSDTKKELMAPHLLHWRLMEDARQQGLAAYDWWGIAPPGHDHHHLAGVGRFKLGFGGEVVSMPPTQDVVIRPLGYRMYSIAKRVF